MSVLWVRPQESSLDTFEPPLTSSPAWLKGAAQLSGVLSTSRFLMNWLLASAAKITAGVLPTSMPAPVFMARVVFTMVDEPELLVAAPMPPPLAAVLADRVELRRLMLPLPPSRPRKMAPPADDAVLPTRVLRVTSPEPRPTAMPPPLSASLLDRVDVVISELRALSTSEM